MFIIFYYLSTEQQREIIAYMLQSIRFQKKISTVFTIQGNKNKAEKMI